jgi:hypothetical protein
MAINRKYKDFIKESYYKNISSQSQNLSSTKLDNIMGTNEYAALSKLSELRDEYADDILSLSPFYKTYFSDLCKKQDLTQSDLDIDYLEMQKLLDKKGWGFETIKNLFSKEVDSVCGKDIFDLVSGSPLDSTNGCIDYYLYRTVEKLGLDKNKIHLGGDGWVSYLYEDNELPIRYKYGYHQTEYGKLMLEQADTTVDEFIEKLTKFLVSMLNEDWRDEVIINVIDNKYNLDRSATRALLQANPEVADFEKYHILEDDRIIFLVSNVVDDLNEILSIINDGNKITNEDFITELSELLYSFGDNIESTGTELILYGDFEKNLES